MIIALLNLLSGQSIHYGEVPGYGSLMIPFLSKKTLLTNQMNYSIKLSLNTVIYNQNSSHGKKEVSKSNDKDLSPGKWEII